MIPYGKQEISQSDIDAVVDVLKSDFLTQGPVTPLFEKAVSEYCGTNYAIAVNSATSALHIACLSLGVGTGDIVWTSSITFVASANCARYCGAEVDFIDINPFTYNLSVESLSAKLELAEKEGTLPKVVIAVHLSGQSCEMEEIYALSKQYDFRIIEDASHAIGGRYKGKVIGSCRYSDIAVFSFHPVKIITTGEGGMALTNDPKLARRMERLRSHGITRDVTEMTKAPDGPWHYQQVELGFNYRLTDIQSALGLSQIQRLDEFVGKRHALAESYNELLKDLPISTPWQHGDSYSSMHLYIIRLHLDEIKTSHLEVYKRLRNSGIGVNLHYIPLYHHPYYAQQGFNSSNYPESEKYYSEAITLPIFPGLNEQLQLNVVKNLSDAIIG